MAELLAAGHSQNEVARRLEIAKSTVAYHARRLGRPVDDRCNRRYEWGEIQRFYDEGNSISQCQARFALVEGARRTTFHLKNRLFAAGLKENRCERCGIDEWLGEPLVMALHHVNGDNHDNRLENLAILCPNCHSQTENFSGRNRNRRLRLVDEPAA